MNRLLLKLTFMPQNREIEVLFDTSISLKENLTLLKNIVDFRFNDEYIVVDAYEKEAISTNLELVKLGLVVCTHLYIYCFDSC